MIKLGHFYSLWYWNCGSNSNIKVNKMKTFTTECETVQEHMVQLSQLQTKKKPTNLSEKLLASSLRYTLCGERATLCADCMMAPDIWRRQSPIRQIWWGEERRQVSADWWQVLIQPHHWQHLANAWPTLPNAGLDFDKFLLLPPHLVTWRGMAAAVELHWFRTVIMRCAFCDKTVKWVSKKSIASPPPPPPP